MITLFEGAMLAEGAEAAAAGDAIAIGSAEIAGAGTAAAKIAPFNLGGRANCVQCVISFLRFAKTGELVPATAETVANGGSIPKALQLIADGVGLRLGTGQWSELATSMPQQLFVVFEGSSSVVSNHVMVGVVAKGTKFNLHFD